MKTILTALIIYLACWMHPAIIFGQDPGGTKNGIEVIVTKPSDRKLNSYVMFSGGYQYPYLVHVPMIPESTSSKEFEIGDDLQANTHGYYFGIGVMNKTKRYLDVGLLADYCSNSVYITRSGERSMGPWVLEQSNGESNYTETFDENNKRVCEVYAIRASVRLKLPAGPMKFWLGLCGGSYTSTVRYTERDEMNFFNSARKTLIAPSYQAGLDIMIRNKQDEDAFSITLYADFGGPVIEEALYDVVISGWDFSVPEGNRVVSPVKFGLALAIH